MYVLARESDASVKVRDGLMDVKRLRGVEGGLEQWVPVMKATFPLSGRPTSARSSMRCGSRPRPRPAPTRLEDLVASRRTDDACAPSRCTSVVVRYTVDGCMAELSEVRTESGATRTIAVESEDPALVLAAVRSLGLASHANVCMARGLKTLVGFATTRYAAIDVGTNSVKLHVGERHADGTWSTVADRAVVTRLGEGLDANGTSRGGADETDDRGDRRDGRRVET